VPVSGAQFIAQAQALALAEQLPQRGMPINLCQDRYHFALGLAAALLRGQTSLMPPNALPETLRRLHEDGGQTLCRDAEQFKAWSQNMGHDGVLTTFLSYGALAPRRQGQIIQSLGLGHGQPAGHAEVLAQAVVQAMRGAGLLSQQG